MWKIVLLAATTYAADLSDFQSKLPWQRPSEGFYEIDFAPQTLLVAIQDMNNDKWLDLITVNPSQDIVSVHYFNGHDYTSTQASFPVSQKVQSVVPLNHQTSALQ